jgi:hypothetical protein
MFHKYKILEDLDSFLETIKAKYSAEEIDFLLEIRNKIAESKSEEDLLEYAFDIVKFMMMLHELFGHK